MKLIRVFFGIGTLSAMLAGCVPKEEEATPAPAPAGSPAPKKEAVSFTKSIKPILSNKCTICHNVEVLPNRPWFETRDSALKSGMIVPGKPDLSRILTVIKEDPEAEKAMPPVSHRLSKEEIALLRTWITEGANWPGGKAGRVEPAFIPQE